MRASEIKIKPPKPRKQRQVREVIVEKRAPRRAKIKLPIAGLQRRGQIQPEVAGEGSMF